MSILPLDVQARLESLHQYVGIAVPDGLGDGLDSLLPIIEYFMSVGGIFFVKWDGKRSSNRYTAIAIHANIDQFRFDDKTPELAAARVMLHLAGPVFGFPEATC